MKFDLVVGNPPFDEYNDNNNRKSPIYHRFMDASYSIATIVELITPARFLFMAGQAPKVWMKKMLEDPCLKVVYFEKDGSKVFPSTDIKGGIAVTIRNENANYGPIEVFTTEPELNTIKNKVAPLIRHSIKDSAFPKSYFTLTDVLYKENPDLVGCLTSGNEKIIDANIFAKMPNIFKEKPFDGSIAVHGRIKNIRMIRYIKCSYIRMNDGVAKYKVFVPGANGTGTFGEMLSCPFVGEPNQVGTQTYMCFGFYDTKEEAESCLKYIKTKFARCMLGILKVTQNNPKEVWRFVPDQDFTDSSDIDWSLSIPEIDRQLYKKYRLDEKEIEFIETHIKKII